jgi:hypothetical protein
LSKVLEKSGEKPRIEIEFERPERRCDVRPGRRAIDSAIEASGSLPMSSAEIDSMTWSRFFFSATAFSSEAAKPVTMISSPCSSSGGVSCACAGTANAVSASAAASACPLTPRAMRLAARPRNLVIKLSLPWFRFPHPGSDARFPLVANLCAAVPRDLPAFFPPIGAREPADHIRIQYYAIVGVAAALHPSRMISAGCGAAKRRGGVEIQCSAIDLRRFLRCLPSCDAARTAARGGRR